MCAALKKFSDRRAFTLMELMIVLVVIGILIASVFKMFSVVASSNRIADTKSRMERLQNAISGFYSSYGTYPPVSTQYGSQDPFNAYSDRGAAGATGDRMAFGAAAANQAARSQPVAFEYPCPQTYDKYINTLLGPSGIYSPNTVYGNAETYTDEMWTDVKMFKFGLMSFLMPRVTVVGNPRGGFNKNLPLKGFYLSRQWRRDNRKSAVGVNDEQKLLSALDSQNEQELREAAKWLPNLEGLVSGNGPRILDTDLGGGGLMNDAIGDGNNFRGAYAKEGKMTILLCSTVVDAWGNDFFYYSAPPYQSYRLWSAGPNGTTFPPWIPLESLSATEREEVSKWIKDDIVGFDR